MSAASPDTDVKMLLGPPFTAHLSYNSRLFIFSLRFRRSSSVVSLMSSSSNVRTPGSAPSRGREMRPVTASTPLVNLRPSTKMSPRFKSSLTLAFLAGLSGGKSEAGATSSASRFGVSPFSRELARVATALSRFGCSLFSTGCLLGRGLGRGFGGAGFAIFEAVFERSLRISLFAAIFCSRRCSKADMGSFSFFTGIWVGNRTCDARTFLKHKRRMPEEHELRREVRAVRQWHGD